MHRFNIRVYGLYVVEGKLLVTDEIRFGIQMTKLPGGGLQFGEGLAGALIREWQEELNVTVEVGDVFYVNPFLQISAFNSMDEVMGLYFWVKPIEPLNVVFKEKPMDFPHEGDDQQVFRWVNIEDLKPEDFTFPVDQSLVAPLRKHFGLTE